MEEEMKISSHSRSKKLCRCAHVCGKKRHNRLYSNEECISYHCPEKKLPCNAYTCKVRREVCFCRSSKISKVQPELDKAVQVLGTIDVDLEKSVTTDKLEMDERPSKLEQTSLVRLTTSDKIISTDLSKNSSYLQAELSNIEKSYESVEVDRNESQFEHTAQNGEAKDNDKDIIDRIQKDLTNERRRTVELEAEKNILTYSLKTLNKEKEQKAGSLKEAMENAEEQAKLAADLSAQLKKQTDNMKEDTEKFLSKIANLEKQLAEVESKNVALTKERDELQDKLNTLSEVEHKKCAEIEEEVNKIKSAVQEKEDALSKERKELKETIMELTNAIKVQEERICEVARICASQQLTLQEKDNELYKNRTELSEVQDAIKIKDCYCKEMEEKVDDLKCCLHEQEKACDGYKQQLETVAENHCCELRIKNKVIEENNKTISKQEKLLYDSKNLVEQVNCENDQLKQKLSNEIQRNNLLEIALDEAENQIDSLYSLECENCKILASKVEYLKQEKHKALKNAKFVCQKINYLEREYKYQLTCKTEEHRSMALKIQNQKKEIEYLKKEFYQESSY